MEAKLLKIKVILKELSEVSYMPRLSLNWSFVGFWTWAIFHAIVSQTILSIHVHTSHNEDCTFLWLFQSQPTSHFTVKHYMYRQIDRYWREVLNENIRSVYGITLMVWLGWAGGSGDVGRVCDICRLENWSDGGTRRSNYGGGGGRVVADTGTQTSRTCWHPDHWVNTMLLWTCVVILWSYVILTRWEL